MNLREDLQIIYDWIPAGSRLLDLGCGDGELLAALVADKRCSGYGVEIDTDSVIAAMARGVNVIQADIERGLQDFGDKSFDVVVLSQTIQSMQDTEAILRCMMRVADQAVVTFPNFGYWHNRLQIMFGGRMPVSERMPYHWYNTPNIHLCTLKDFELLCGKNKIRVHERAVMQGNKKVGFLPNLMGSLAFYRVG